MGRIRVAGLDFKMEYLHSEIAALRAMIHRDGWIVRENLTSRQAAVKGLTFVMLNLERGVDEDEAWRLFHEVMDEYYDLCDRHHISI
jgi:hypothetical protein